MTCTFEMISFTLKRFLFLGLLKFNLLNFHVEDYLFACLLGVCLLGSLRLIKKWQVAPQSSHSFPTYIRFSYFILHFCHHFFDCEFCSSRPQSSLERWPRRLSRVLLCLLNPQQISIQHCNHHQWLQLSFPEPMNSWSSCKNDTAGCFPCFLPSWYLSRKQLFESPSLTLHFAGR